jgi:hypothetical protein
MTHAPGDRTRYVRADFAMRVGQEKPTRAEMTIAQDRSGYVSNELLAEAIVGIICRMNPADDSFYQQPAFWSAVAALGSATAAWLTFLVHRSNRNVAIRPELVLEGFTYDVAGGVGTLSILALKNVGRGLAQHVEIDAYSKDRDHLALSTVACNRAIMAADESATIKFIAEINWSLVRKAHFLSVVVWAQYYDLDENLYTTTYELFAANQLSAFANFPTLELVPGLGYHWRSTARSHWLRTQVIRLVRIANAWRAKLKYTQPFRDVE